MLLIRLQRADISHLAVNLALKKFTINEKKKKNGSTADNAAEKTAENGYFSLCREFGTKKP